MTTLASPITFEDVDPFAGPPPTPVQQALLDARANPTPPPATLPAGIESIVVEPGSPEWMRTVSASKVAAILGVSPYTSAYTMWHQMMGLEAPEADKPIFQRGHLLEPAVANWFASQHPEWAVVETGTWTHATRPHQTASPDRLVLLDGNAFDPFEVYGGPFDLLEIKSTTKDHEWGTPGTAEVPLYYWVQAIWQMDTVGKTRCHFAIIGSFLEFSAYVVDYDPVAAAIIRAEVDAFVESMDTGRPPAIDHHVTTLATVRAQHPNVSDAVADLPYELAHAYAKAVAVSKAGKAMENAAKAAIADAMGDAKAAVTAGITVATRRLANPSATTPSIYPGKHLDNVLALPAPAPVVTVAPPSPTVAALEATLKNAEASSGSAAAAPGEGEVAPSTTAAASPEIDQQTASDVVASDGDTPHTSGAEVDDARNLWLKSRLVALKTGHPDAFEAFRAARHARLPDLTPTPPWTNDEIDAVDAILGGFEPSFMGEDPAKARAREAEEQAKAAEVVETEATSDPVPTWGTDAAGCAIATDLDEGGIKSAIAQLHAEHEDRFRLLSRWHADAATQGRPWKGGDHHQGLSQRQWHVARAALAAMRNVWDAPKGYPHFEDRVRALIALTIGEDLQPTWTTGAVIGSLTVNQAEAFVTNTEMFATGDRSVRAVAKAA
jgi:putative phage-type endonuclease